MLNQEPERNIEDLTDEEIYSAIHYPEFQSQSNKKHDDREVSAMLIERLDSSL